MLASSGCSAISLVECKSRTNAALLKDLGTERVHHTAAPRHRREPPEIVLPQAQRLQL